MNLFKSFTIVVLLAALTISYQVFEKQIEKSPDLW